MPETHINAFFAEVDEKQKSFERAAAELQNARDRLETKKKQVGYVDPVVAKEPEVAKPQQDYKKR